LIEGLPDLLLEELPLLRVLMRERDDAGERRFRVAKEDSDHGELDNEDAEECALTMWRGVDLRLVR
jgi:hypothetical protein